MIVSRQIEKLIADQEGWTRRMFEEGLKIKKLYGEENVYDFSLGNPDTEPPETLQRMLVDTLASPVKGMHRYMTNSGYEEVRLDIAEYLREIYGLPFTASHVFMTNGAAGGLNILLKVMLNRKDEVIAPSPFFWEFKNYVNNHGGTLKAVQSKDDFQLDIDRIADAINPRTRAVLINSPNNPTGAVYSEKSVTDLVALLNHKRSEGQDIYLIADDAYRKLVYDGTGLPNLFASYDLTCSINSHSKDLALPGERIGYIAISPRLPDSDLLISGLMITQRTLGFVNAPALFQRVVSKFQRTSVDIAEYQRKRDILYDALVEGGFDCVKPRGAFYMFPRSPVADELKFIRALQQDERIMVVPGRGFGKKGYFRIAYCVPMSTIEKSIDGFIRIGKRFIKR
ncbi:MAG: pyridoxal phosphate-dependent aminotransferase [Syntrophorhabdaceae bacterium]|mgnify:FL=1|nr:pyridoxal phosphate-dependent aminotransferase [Syntrophorhabdaceae bacterium]MDD4196181.1 pyridoxal phosphate-dependent aminotransferase [Syntrophorhabdaceae bacterium]HOC46445.1 pyridoxal phosphate-dependent aminotransferase [Syntrophorhabdaceae bacterium]